VYSRPEASVAILLFRDLNLRRDPRDLLALLSHELKRFSEVTGTCLRTKCDCSLSWSEGAIPQTNVVKESAVSLKQFVVRQYRIFAGRSVRLKSFSLLVC